MHCNSCVLNNETPAGKSSACVGGTQLVLFRHQTHYGAVLMNLPDAGAYGDGSEAAKVFAVLWAKGWLTAFRTLGTQPYQQKRWLPVFLGTLIWRRDLARCNRKTVPISNTQSCSYRPATAIVSFVPLGDGILPPGNQRLHSLGMGAWAIARSTCCHVLWFHCQRC